MVDRRRLRQRHSRKRQRRPRKNGTTSSAAQDKAELMSHGWAGCAWLWESLAHAPERPMHVLRAQGTVPHDAGEGTLGKGAVPSGGGGKQTKPQRPGVSCLPEEEKPGKNWKIPKNQGPFSSSGSEEERQCEPKEIQKDQECGRCSLLPATQSHRYAC